MIRTPHFHKERSRGSAPRGAGIEMSAAKVAWVSDRDSTTGTIPPPEWAPALQVAESATLCGSIFWMLYLTTTWVRSLAEGSADAFVVLWQA
ncbi:MAG TPA: hypothetical protein PK208_10220 [Fibrobacteria bacterium]|nr:hypothetical protein [Fibrobacteria bacterium]